MSLLQVIRTALTALRVNMLRAALTTLGIIIGIAAVIVMMEIGQGSAKAIQSTIESMGATNLLVLPGTAASGGVSYGSGSVMNLTMEDSDAIEREIPGARYVAPIVRARTQVVYGNKNWVPFQINGTIPNYLKVRDWSGLFSGTMFTDQDVRSGNKVCVLGQTLVRELFGTEDPLGKEVRVRNVAFKVIGVLSRKGANMMGMDQDDVLLAPWTTIKYRVFAATTATTSPTATGAAQSPGALYPSTGVELYPEASAGLFLSNRRTNVDQVLVAAASPEQVGSTIQQITLLLRERHRIREGEPDDFNIRDMTEMTRALSSTSKLMTRLLLGVALISLVVGGVGIMNIMLVSVTERTREIGLRMAVGARGKDILRQFLAEAILLCLVGGVLGILLGRGTGLLVSILLKWPVETSIPAIIAAFAVSVGVGLIFGYYPAAKAARLDPIQALRYE